MGWTNSHLHAFRLGDARYGMHLDKFPEGEIDEKTVTVLHVLRDEPRFTFDYDFGDSWEHEVVIEDLSWSEFGLKTGSASKARMPARPRTRGVSGYGHLLEAIADPRHEEHQSTRDE